MICSVGPAEQEGVGREVLAAGGPHGEGRVEPVP